MKDKKCPICKSEDLIYKGRKFLANKNETYYNVICESCGHKWKVVIAKFKMPIAEKVNLFELEKCFNTINNELYNAENLSHDKKFKLMKEEMRKKWKELFEMFERHRGIFWVKYERPTP